MAGRTTEIAVEQEVASLVNAAAAGDFSRRLAESGKEGFFCNWRPASTN